MKKHSVNCTISGCGLDGNYGTIGKKPYCEYHYDKFIVTKPLVSEQKKTGRNEKCSCGSGKKFKNCCMLKETKNYHYYKNNEKLAI